MIAVDPFGAAKPVDTAQKEREIEEKLAKAKLGESSATPAAAAPAASSTATATDDASGSPAPPAGKTVPAAPKQNPWRKPSVTDPNGAPTAAEKQVEDDAAKADAPATEATSEAEPARATETTV